MNILEQEIEDVIWNSITAGNQQKLEERGLPIHEHYTYVRQFELGRYGRVDLLGFYVRQRSRYGGKREVDVQVIEMKKESVNMQTFMQAVRYVRGIQHSFQEAGYDYDLNFHIILIGKTIDINSDFAYITDALPEVNFFTYTIDLESGILFHPEWGYHLVEPAFVNNRKTLHSIMKVNVKNQYKNIFVSQGQASDDLPY